jgi:hypothetical protein
MSLTRLSVGANLGLSGYIIYKWWNGLSDEQKSKRYVLKVMIRVLKVCAKYGYWGLILLGGLFALLMLWMWLAMMWDSFWGCHCSDCCTC